MFSLPSSVCQRTRGQKEEIGARSAPPLNKLGLITMSQKCEICGKTPAIGKRVTTRGKAKYLGGVGTKITGISPRQFRPNLQRIRITDENGAPRRVRVCVQCIRSGRVTKRIKNRPFALPADAAALLAAAREKKAQKKGKKS